jgi:hypothetical protein
MTHQGLQATPSLSLPHSKSSKVAALRKEIEGIKELNDRFLLKRFVSNRDRQTRALIGVSNVSSTPDWQQVPRDLWTSSSLVLGR